LIRDGEINPPAATSFLNDSRYAYGAVRELIAAARTYYVDKEEGLAEVEQLLYFDEEDLDEAASTSSKATGGSRRRSASEVR
jgi:phosphate:Na+ symporter